MWNRVFFLSQRREERRTTAFSWETAQIQLGRNLGHSGRKNNIQGVCEHFGLPYVRVEP